MNKSFQKLRKSFTCLVFVTALIMSAASGVDARKLTTELAPGYENVPFVPEKAFVSIELAESKNYPGMADTAEVRNEFEKLEVAANSALIIKNSPGHGEHAAKILPYLKKSEQMIDSAKLRVIARMKKLELITKSGNKEYAEFYKNIVTAPVAFMIGQNPGQGGSQATRNMHLFFKDGTYYFFNGYINLNSLEGYYQLIDRINNDTLDICSAHENAHGIMFDMYGAEKYKIKNGCLSTSGHDGPVISDRALAFIEGWAEAFEALYGPTNPIFNFSEAEREKYGISEFQYTRQDPVRRDRYIWQNYKVKNGLLKNGLQIIATEGAIASQFYDIFTSRVIKNAFTKSVALMYNYKPADFVEFLNAWVKDNPEDRNVLYRIFLENTNYATASNESRRLYADYYQAKLKYVQKQLEEAKFREIKNKWLAFKEALFADVMKTGNIGANVGPDLWLDFPAKKQRINLSTITSEYFAHLKLANLSNEDIATFIKAREAMGVLTGTSAVETLRTILGAEKADAVINANGLSDLK
ncbi:MAG TPA: hypothetical protein PKK26_12285 [Candidatus Wallbacteria bacterium]|nr:hypothetical protein [Candidatus Wallbacteria bacterium]